MQDSQPRRGNNALTDADVSIQKGTVQATRNAGKVGDQNCQKALPFITFILLLIRKYEYDMHSLILVMR